METADCPFKSSEELGLTQAERDALIKTLLMMEAGKMESICTREQANSQLPEGSHGFNMAVWNTTHPCGTVACIGGNAELLGGLPLKSLSKKCDILSRGGEDDLRRLFFGFGGDTSPRGAAKVLRGYLMTGQTKWR